MKTAKEWLESFFVPLQPEDIRAIQADALRHAAKIAYENLDCVTHDDITEEADKLETK